MTYTQRGFTLVEMALVLMVMGLLLAGVFAILKPYQLKQKREVTLDRMEQAVIALNNFAQRTGRLPCPAAPDAGIPGQMRANCATDTLRDGVVPFAELGLTRQMATDGFGNPLTYVVAAAVADINIAPPTNVHDMCRQFAWIFEDPNTGARSNRNAVKAGLCCQDVRVAANQVTVIANPATNQSAVPTQAAPAPLSAPTAAEFGTADDYGSLVDPTRALDYVAYAVISHGANGELSYLWGQPARRAAQSVPGNAETENADNDSMVVDWQELVGSPPRLERVHNDSAGPQRYDDIVIWKTQTAITRTSHNDSCNRP